MVNFIGHDFPVLEGCFIIILLLKTKQKKKHLDENFVKYAKKLFKSHK